MMKKTTRYGVALLSILVCTASQVSLFEEAALGNQGFYLEELPEGSTVTLPQPVTTYMGMQHRIKISATDVPQTLKLQSVRTDRRAAKKVRLAIHDRQANAVIHIEVGTDTPYLYTFRGLGTITLVPEVSEADLDDAHLRIAIDSNKPLEFARY